MIIMIKSARHVIAVCPSVRTHCSVLSTVVHANFPPFQLTRVDLSQL